MADIPDQVTLDIARIRGHGNLKGRAYRKLFDLLDAPPPSGRVLIYPRYYHALLVRAWRLHGRLDAPPPDPETTQLYCGDVRICRFDEAAHG